MSADWTDDPCRCVNCMSSTAVTERAWPTAQHRMRRLCASCAAHVDRSRTAPYSAKQWPPDQLLYVTHDAEYPIREYVLLSKRLMRLRLSKAYGSIEWLGFGFRWRNTKLDPIMPHERRYLLTLFQVGNWDVKPFNLWEKW